MLHLRVFEVRYLDMVRRCIADGTGFGVVALLSGNEVRSPEGLETLAPVGTMARIESWDAPMPALLALRCVGAGRFRLHASQLAKYGLWMGEAEAIADDPPAEVPADLQDCADALGRLIAGWQREGVPAEHMPLAPPFRLDDCGWVADRWCELLPLPAAEQAGCWRCPTRGAPGRRAAGVAGRELKFFLDVMEIRIDEGLRAYIDPLTEDESAALERSLLAEGCRDALVLWGDLLIDGHNRYALCRKHNIPFETRQNTSFKSIEDVYLWMIENHLGRRSVSDFQRGVLALRKREILQSRSTPPWDEGARAEGDESVPTAASHAGGDAEGDGAGPKPVVMSQAQGRAELSRQALARGAHQQQHAGPDREDPEGSRAGTGAGRRPARSPSTRPPPWPRCRRNARPPRPRPDARNCARPPAKPARPRPRRHARPRPRCRWKRSRTCRRSHAPARGAGARDRGTRSVEEEGGEPDGGAVRGAQGGRRG